MSTYYQTQRPSSVRAGSAHFANLLACGEFYTPAARPAQRPASVRPITTLSESYSRLPLKRSTKPIRHESTYSTSA